MDDQATAELRHTGNGKGEPIVPTQLNVTVTPKGPPNGNEVAVSVTGDAHGNVIFLNDATDYEINFTLSTDASVTSWHANPFANGPGNACPPPNAQPNGNFSVRPGQTPTSMTVAVRAFPQAHHQRPILYRLNFNGSLTSDPIIVVGDV